VDYDAATLRQASGGDDAAFQALIEPHLPRCYRIAYMITRNPDDASDALQEAVYRVYRSLRNFKPGRPFYPWFARIAAREALKVAKRSSRQPAPIPLPETEAGETPEGTVLAREEQLRLWEAIQTLPPDQRAVIVLRYYGDMSEQEMANALGVRPGTVKSRLHRAKAALENLLLADQTSRRKARIVPFQTDHDGGDAHE